MTSVPTVNITKSYTGHIYDEGTGFGMQVQEKYDPFTKRFTSMDPENGNIYMPDTLHKYSYASNNPVMNVDLNGRFTTSTFEKAAMLGCKSSNRRNIHIHKNKQLMCGMILII